MHLHTFASKLMGFLTSAIQKQHQLPRRRGGGFLLAVYVCGFTPLVAASRESPPGLDSPERKERKKGREGVRHRGAIKVYKVPS